MEWWKIRLARFPGLLRQTFSARLSGRNAKTGEKFLDTTIAVFYESGGKRHLETRNPRYVTNAFLELCDHYYIGIPRHFGSKPTPEILKQRPRVIWHFESRLFFQRKTKFTPQQGRHSGKKVDYSYFLSPLYLTTAAVYQDRTT